MTYFPPPEKRTIVLPLMTPDEADRLLQLVDAIASAIYARWEEWAEEQLELPFPAAMEIAVPPHPTEQARHDDDAHSSRVPPECPPVGDEPNPRQDHRPD